MWSGDQPTDNIQTAFQAIDDAARYGADWVLLPEVWTYQGSYKSLYDAADDPRGAIYSRLAAKAAEHGIGLFAGSYAEKPSDPEAPGSLNQEGQRRVYNVSYVFDRRGAEVARYCKSHLFSLYNDAGQALYSEADGFIPGEELVVTRLDGWSVGLSTCYDLRFPGLYMALNRQAGGPLDMLVVPSAFTLQTGKDHWELLLRARAVENQCYVFAANQYGENRPGRHCYGHSMIVGPWGDKLADTGEGYGIAVARVSKAHMQEVRNRLPALKNQRQELY
jgi:predicted amidohydrolase